MRYSVFSNGKVLTPAGVIDGGVLVRDGVVAGIVSPREARDVAKRTDVDRIDLGRGCLIPGFIDAHFHLIALALKSLRCDLSAATSADALVERMRHHAASSAPDAPVVGVDWDESSWDDQDLPSRERLDTISRTTPVYARRICGHVGVANGALLGRLKSAARYVNATSGVITEEAVFEANRICYPPDEWVARSMEPAIRQLHALGITGIHDIIDASHFDTYLDGLERSRFPLRIDGLFHVAAERFPAIGERARRARATGFRAAGIKLFADGSLGARTAALRKPYADAAAETGDLLVDEDTLRAEVVACLDQGIVCAVHAIGDRAISTVLDAMSHPGAAPGQLRIEHAEILSARLVERLARRQVMLAMQPNFVREWAGEGGLYERRLGSDRWRWNNPFRSLESSGVPFVFSSDGMPAGPLFGMRGATRHPVEAQRLTPANALARYTSAVESFVPYQRGAGNISPGAVADFALLSGDPHVADLDTLRVRATFIAGVPVYGASVAP